MDLNNPEVQLNNIHLQLFNDPRFINAVYESLILYKKLKKIKQNYMKTQNEYPIQNLVSMPDFVLELEKKIYDGDLVFQKLGVLATRYAKFLKPPLKLEMFVPVNGDEKVLFKGFTLKKENRKGLVFDKVETYLYRENATLPFAEIHEKERLRFIAIPAYGGFIENVTGFGLELTDTALKQIFGHAGN